MQVKLTNTELRTLIKALDRYCVDMEARADHGARESYDRADIKFAKAELVRARRLVSEFIKAVE